jgi:hypothetical protein
MATIKMNITKAGRDSLVGKVMTFDAGQTYPDIDPELAQVFVTNGWATDVDAPAPSEPSVAEVSEAEIAEGDTSDDEIVNALAGMTMAELRDFAAKNELELTVPDNAKKADLLADVTELYLAKVDEASNNPSTFE